jgi:hypothetical protein
MGASHRGRRSSPRTRGTWVGSLPFAVCSRLPRHLTDRRKNDVHTIITLTDKAPEGLNGSLSSFPLATKVSPSFHTPFTSRDDGFVSKLGLFSSSTPFVTGRPHTLIFNGSVASSGAVGIALSAGRRPTLRTAFPGLCAITPPLKVTRCV